MNLREIILNLWDVRDESGVIYSVRIKPYVMSGTDEEKLYFLQSRALLDYLVARPFPVPESYHIRTDPDQEPIPVAHVQMFGSIEEMINLFEEGIKVISAGIPSQSDLEIS